jgi:hypothetical protein
MLGVGTKEELQDLYAKASCFVKAGGWGCHGESESDDACEKG